MNIDVDNSFKRLWRHISPKRRMQLLMFLGVLVLASFAEVVSIGAVLPFLCVLMAPERVFSNSLVQPIVTALGLTEAHQLLLPLTVIFILAALFSGFMRLILLWAQARLGFSIGSDLSVEIYKRTLDQPYLVHAARNSSEVIAAISTKTNMVINYTLMSLLYALSSFFILIAIMTAFLIMDHVLAIVVFGGFGALYGLIILSTKKRLALDSQRISHESNQAIKVLQEGLGGIRDVLIDGTQAIYCKVYRNADQPLRRSQASTQIIAGMPRYIIESLGMTLIAILAFWRTESQAGITNAIPILGALAIGAQRLLPVLQQLYSSWSHISGNKSALLDVLDLLDQPLRECPAQSSSITFQKSIRINQVNFSYAADAPLVLRGIDIEIHKGSRIGFIGATGSGKSTLIDLVMALLQPTNGNLSIDGVQITSQNSRAWQMHIAHVPQTIFLTDSTVTENIAFGVPPERIDHVRVRNAARQARIATTIEAWEHQYSTYVGERGIRLSGGQRQRLGIARALYKQADVIVLDEATSALDTDTENEVMGSIKSIGKDITVLVVAHRLSTLQDCDLIFQLAQGEVKRTMTYSEVMLENKLVAIN